MAYPSDIDRGGNENGALFVTINLRGSTLGFHHCNSQACVAHNKAIYDNFLLPVYYHLFRCRCEKTQIVPNRNTSVGPLTELIPQYERMYHWEYHIA